MAIDRAKLLSPVTVKNPVLAGPSAVSVPMIPVAFGGRMPVPIKAIVKECPAGPTGPGGIIPLGPSGATGPTGFQRTGAGPTRGSTGASVGGKGGFPKGGPTCPIRKT